MAEELTRLNQLRLMMTLQLELNQQQTRNIILITNELHQERRRKKQRDDAEKLYGKKKRKMLGPKMVTKKTRTSVTSFGSITSYTKKFYNA